MGLDALSSISNGEVASEDKWNQIKRAYAGDICPRNNSTKLVSDLSGKAGNSTYRFNDCYAKQYYTDYFSISRNLVTGSTVNFNNKEMLINSESVNIPVGIVPHAAITTLKTTSITTNGSPIEVSLLLTAPGTADNNVQYKITLFQYTNYDQYSPSYGFDIELSGSFYSTPTQSVGGVIWLPTGTYNIYEHGFAQSAVTCSRILQIREMVA